MIVFRGQKKVGPRPDWSSPLYPSVAVFQKLLR